MGHIVYVDILFLLNFFVNTITIYISFLLTKQDLKLWRLVLSAGFLALYACVIFFPKIQFMYSILGKAAALMLACFIAYPTKSWARLIKNTAVLFLSSAILGGIIFTLIFATDFGTTVGSAVSNGEFYFNVNASTLMISILLAYSCVHIIAEIKKSTLLYGNHISRIKIRFQENEICIKGFWDTGCTLCEPLSKIPAIVINQSSAKKLLPKELFDFCINNKHTEIPDKYLNRYRLIPYSTIDSEKGVLSGIFPDKTEIDNTEVKKVIIAISKEELCHQKSFDAIFGTELFEEIKIPERTSAL